MAENSRTIGIWAGQAFHFTSLALLLVLVGWLWTFLGKPFPAVFWTAAAFPIAHQLYVWLAWRWELRSSAVSRSIGFRGYIVVFFILLAGRLASLLVLAWLDRGSLQLGLVPQAGAAVLLALPGVYTMYSVVRYFGFERAAGADHFESRYRTMPLVDKGVFSMSKNSMYAFGFLLLWAVALGFGSSAAMAVAAFSHVYIWVHYFATEKPDMAFLYREDDS